MKSSAYYLVTTPPTFKSTVCGGNAKEIYGLGVFG